MSEAIELKQGKNEVEIIGLMKSIDFEKKEINGQNGKREAITGNAVVEVVDGDKVNNIRVEVFAFQLTKNGSVSKLYTGLQTVSDDYKTIDKDGREQADMVRVQGQLSGNIYASNDEINEGTRVQGRFFNRVDDKSTEQSALAQVQMFINGISDKMDSDGMPTGTKKVDGYFVEYGNRIGRVVDLIVEGELADQFDEMFAKGDTAELTMKIQAFADKVSVKPTNGFGVQKNIGGGSFTRNFEIIGGSEPYQDERAYDEEASAEILKKYDEMKKAALTQGGGSKISKESTNGFGAAKTSASSNPFNATGTKTQDSPDGGFAF